MSVYYVHAPELALVKIGHSADAINRFQNMQTGSPTRLVLLAMEDGGAEIEATRHAEFAHLRRRGEWFEYGPDLAALIASLAPHEPKVRPFGPSDLSAATGWSKSYCCELLRGTRRITVKTAAHIYRTSGIAMGALADLSEADRQLLVQAIPPKGIAA